MPTLEKQLMRLTFRQLAALVQVEVEVSVEDRSDLEKFLDVPLRLLAAEFRTRAAFRAFVLHKLERAEDRKRVRRIAAFFEADEQASQRGKFSTGLTLGRDS